MLRVPGLWQRSCQLGIEWANGPNLPLRPAKLLRENDCRGELKPWFEFHFEHVQVLAGEQLPQKSASGTTSNGLAYEPFVLFRG